MRTRLLTAAWCGLSLLMLVGCDMMMPDDVADRHDQMRRDRAIPAAHELPPGLGDDLPPPPTPLVKER